MYPEFWLKFMLGTLAVGPVLLHARRQAKRLPAVPADVLERLRIPFVLALVFFAGSFLLTRNGFLVQAMMFDPALPVWVVVCAFKLLLLGYFAKQAFACPENSLRQAHMLMFGLIFIGATAVETVLILPAAPLVGPEKYDEHGVTLQTLQVTCVPSSLTTICRLYGEPMTEYDAVRQVKTLFIGSLSVHSIAGCRNLGFKEATYSSKSLAQILDENLPFLITVDGGFKNVEHAIAVIGSNDNDVFLADPLRGLVKISRDTFMHLERLSIVRLGPREGYATIPLLADFKPEKLKRLF